MGVLVAFETFQKKSPPLDVYHTGGEIQDEAPLRGCARVALETDQRAA